MAQNYFWTTYGPGDFSDPGVYTIGSPTGPVATTPPTTYDTVTIAGGPTAADAIDIYNTGNAEAGTLYFSGYDILYNDVFVVTAQVQSGVLEITTAAEIRADRIGGGSLEIGSGTASTARVLLDNASIGIGAITVDAGSSLVGSGLLGGFFGYSAVTDNGLIEASSGTLAGGSIDGTGIVQIDQSTRLQLDGGASGVTIAFAGPSASLQLGEVTTSLAVSGFSSSGDEIQFEFGRFPNGTDQLTYDPGSGTLALQNSSGTVASVILQGDESGVTFSLIEEAASVTDMVAAARIPATQPVASAGTVSGDSFVWNTVAAAAWNDASSWLDTTTAGPAATAPGLLDSVTISGDAQTDFTVVTGTGNANALVVHNNVLFDGIFVTNTLADQTSGGPAGIMAIAPGAAVDVTGDASIRGGLSLGGDGSVLDVGGTLTLNEAASSAPFWIADGGHVQASVLDVVSGTIQMGATAQLGVGVASGSAHPGDLVVGSDGRVVFSGGTVQPTIWNDGVVELVSGNPTIAEISGAGIVQVDSGFGGSAGVIDASETIRFAGQNAVLVFSLDAANAFPTIDGMQATDALEFSGDYVLAGQDTNATRTVLSLINRETNLTQAVTFEGNYTGQTFTLTNILSQGSKAEITVSSSVPCFCPGTLIATGTGEQPVETLAIGDLVRTAAGVTRPVLWVGRRSYAQRFAAGNTDIMPVCIRAGALGEGLPRRDLLVSPKHAMLLDGVLVPAGLLVNGVSILQPELESDVQYLHIELEDHDLLLAEGAATESFVDDDSRGMFHNAHEYTRLYPERVATTPVWCAPRVESGHALEAIRLRLMADTGVSELDQAPGLQVQIDEARAGRLRGWAWCAEHPDMPVCLDVLLDGQVVTQVLADRFRRDLAVAGIGAGCHGFELALPGLTSASTVTLRRSLDGLASSSRRAA